MTSVSAHERDGGRGYREHVNPHLSELLRHLALDRRFVRGHGCYLFDTEGNAYLDAVAGYGAVPFGHNPASIWSALRDVEARGEPALVQPSVLAAAGELAERLVGLAPEGLRFVTFANSGAEAVEAAIKAARLATGRLGIVAADNGFHGKTLGALSATGRVEYQEGTGAPASDFEFVPYGDPAALAASFEARSAQIAAFIVEPIQGEGGVLEPPPGYLKLVRRLCDRYDVLLIVDEIQTGLGRTGELFACQGEHVAPDIMTLGKALGGGLMPIGACLLSDRAYSEAFARKHSSTFAGNTLAARAGLRVLDELTAEDGSLLERVSLRGMELARGLRELARRYPSAIRAVRGRGLMLGVELGSDRARLRAGDGALLCMLEAMDGLGAFAASYLLNCEQVRVAPTLNGGNVVRVQPPLTISQDDCARVVGAFARLAGLLASGRSDRLVAHLTESNHGVQAELGEGSYERRVVVAAGARATTREPGRFAFIAHPLDDRSYAEFDPALRELSDAGLGGFSTRIEGLGSPFAVSEVRIESEAGFVAEGHFIAVPKTAEQLLRLSPEQALDEVSAAVRVAKQVGAKIVGLGGYTSIVAKSMRALLGLGVPLTTGNSYTTVAAVEAAVEATRATGHPLETSRATIVGGGGSIGSALAGLLAERVRCLTLVGRRDDAGLAKARFAAVLARALRHLARQREAGFLYAAGSLAEQLSRLPVATQLACGNGRAPLAPEREAAILEQVAPLPIAWTDDLAGAVADSDLVFLATSSPEQLLSAPMVRPGTVICDLSRPSNVSDELAAREDVLVIDGGLVAVPGRPDLGWRFGCPPGVAYACMAETMLLALEHRYEHTSLGRDLNPDTLESLRGLAGKHGFRLADFRSKGRPLDATAWAARFGRSSRAA